MVPTLGAVLAGGVLVGALALGAAAGPHVGDRPAPAGPRAGAAAGRGDPSTARPAAAAYRLPLAGEPAVLRRFVAPADLWAAGHRGVDLAGAVGARVLAPAGGTVAFAGTVVDRGVVTVAHPDGLRSSLEPVAWSVAAGERVQRGEVIGTVQVVAGHCAPASCVHWGVRRDERYLDPIALVARPAPVVLLPGP